jgi:hypothetical protein
LDNQEAVIGQYLNRHLDESTLSSDSDDAALELDPQLQFPSGDSSSSVNRASRAANVFSFNNFPENWTENEAENDDAPFPWNLDQMSTGELKQLASELYERVSLKTNSYPERIANYTEADLSVVLEEFKHNFSNLLELVNTESVDDDTADEIDEKLEQLDERKNVLFRRLTELRRKKERCADLILRFRANADPQTSRLMSDPSDSAEPSNL